MNECFRIIRKTMDNSKYISIFRLCRNIDEDCFGLGAVSHMNEDGVQLPVEIPPPLCSQCDRPGKDVAFKTCWVDSIRIRICLMETCVVLVVVRICSPNGSNCTWWDDDPNFFPEILPTPANKLPVCCVALPSEKEHTISYKVKM